jgi:TctA family transporter
MTATILTTATTYNFQAYMMYLPIVITLTVFVSQFLFKNSKTFMIDIFHQKEDIAMATNSLFKIGFYLLNIGFALCIIEFFQIESVERLVVELSQKVGGFSIYLGVMMLLNLLLFLKGRKHAMNKEKQMEHENTDI